MSEFLVRSRDYKIVRCEADGYLWGRMEAYSVFKNSIRQFEEWPNKLLLIKCPNLSKAEGELLIGKCFSPVLTDNQHQTDLLDKFETTLPDWQFQLSLSDG